MMQFFVYNSIGTKVKAPMMAPQNIFDQCAETHRNIELKLCDFYFSFPKLSAVTIATSFLISTRNFLKLSFQIYPYNEILKVSKNKI